MIIYKNTHKITHYIHLGNMTCHYFPATFLGIARPKTDFPEFYQQQQQQRWTTNLAPTPSGGVAFHARNRQRKKGGKSL